ncbi:spermidine synthase [Myroides sp. LJL110]
MEKKINSQVNNQLQLIWQNGRLVLDTEHTNYSYGKLQNVLKDGLAYIGVEKIKRFQNVLILGLGAGGVLQTLRQDICYTNNIDSVEVDPLVIDIGRKYFNLDKFQNNHNIFVMDAFEFVLSNKTNYDLIIIDIFQDYHMPNFLFAEYFQNHLLKMLNKHGFILFNTIAINQQALDRNQAFFNSFDPAIYSIRKYPKSLQTNQLFTIKKL